MCVMHHSSKRDASLSPTLLKRSFTHLVEDGGSGVLPERPDEHGVRLGVPHAAGQHKEMRFG